MKKLHVIYAGWGEKWPFATLADNGRELLFEYTPEAMGEGLELSPLHLKLRPQAYGNFPLHLQRLPGLIADCLPDGWGMLLMDRIFRSQGLDLGQISPLDRLAFVGSRSLGAFMFEPAQPMDFSAQDLALLDLARNVQKVMSGHADELLCELAAIGGSPHGARPKALVFYQPDSGQISTHSFNQAQSWLVKFPAQGEHKEVCAIEAMYAEMARACGLEMPAARYFDLAPELSAFGVERFDTVNACRIPVHSLAGLLHADFRIPSSVDYTSFLRATRMLTRDDREVKKAFERAVFNVVFHNRDDHCKNFSFRLDRDRTWRLAPCYDLTFSEGPGGEHQMDIVGQGRAITRDHLLTLAQQGGLDRHWAGQVIDRIAQVASEIAQFASQAPIRKSTVSQLVAKIQANCDLCG
jgi:serine/threonine-protein kinase HipA